MTVKQFAVRIKPEGTAETVQAARTTEAAFVHTAEATEAANRRAEESAARLAKKYALLAEAARSSAQAEAAQGRFNAALGVSGGSGASARDSAAVFMADDGQAERAARLKAILDPLGAAQDRYNDELREFNQLAVAGRISQTELSQAQAIAKTRLDETTLAIRNQERGLSRLAVASRLNLARQGADVAVTAAMGMNPAMIAIQQGPQILDAWATSAIKLSPALIAAGAAAGILGGAAAIGAGAFLKGEAAALGYERAVTGIGRTAGLTSGELRRMVEAAAEQGDVSISSAQKQAAAYLATGRIGRTVLVDLIAVGRDYAAMMGVDAEQATKDLATAMTQPDKAARDLTRQMGLLDQKTLDHIDSLVKSGDLMAAQRVLMDGISAAAAGHADKVGMITSAWDAVGRSISDAISKLGTFLYLDENERRSRAMETRMRIERGQRDNGRPLDARSKGIYDNAGREIVAIDQAAAAREQQARAAASNQTAQLDRDRREAAARAGRGAARSAEAEARRQAREAEQAAREARQRARREEDVQAAKASELARARGDSDELRRLEDANAVRARTRQLIDDGTAAEKARAQAIAEQAPLIEARRSASVAEADSLMRAARVELERIKGNDTLADQMARHDELLRRINAYTATGIGYYEAWTRAARDLADVEAARADVLDREVEAAAKQRDLRLAQLRGDGRSARAIDRDIQISGMADTYRTRDGYDPDTARLRATSEFEDETRAALIGARRGWALGLAQDIRQSGIKGALAEQLENAGDRMLENLIDGLMQIKWGDLFKGAGQGGGDAGNWLSRGLNWLISSAGRNADGTDNWRGGLTWVGERGPELLNLPRGSQITPHGESLAMSRRGVAASAGGTSPLQVNYAPVYNVNGSGPEIDALRRQMARDRVELPGMILETVSDARTRRIIE